MNARRARATLVVALSLLAPSVPASAQQAARADRAPSAYIPLDDPATPIIDALVARGIFDRLSALERPYRAQDVLDAFGERRDGGFTSIPPELVRWAVAAYEAARRYGADEGARRDSVRVRGSLVPVVTAQSTGRRELMLPDTTKGGVYPRVDVRLSLQSPAFVGVTRVRVDRALEADPEFTGKADRVVAGRVEDAYLATRWKYAALDVGRLARNWGPARLAGLQLGDYADSYDHVQLVLGVDRLHLTTIAARLDDMRVSPDTVAQRYFAIHRLAGRWRALELAASEAVVYGGPSRGFEPILANPLGFYDLAQYDEHKSLNVSYGFDAALRAGRAGLWTAQLLVDDFQIDNCDSNCKEPPSLGYSVGVEGVRIPPRVSTTGFASYTRVDNLVYRTPSRWERYASLGLGLGRGQSDYDELRAGVEVAPPLALGRLLRGDGPLRLYAALRRQGEGDYHLPFPTRAQYPTTPEFLAGTVERVRRAAAEWTVSGPVSISADVGYQWTSNADHVAGRSRSGVEGRVRVSLPGALRFDRAVSDQ